MEEQSADTQSEIEIVEEKPKPRMIPVKAIDRKGASVLLEWQDPPGVYHRGYLPFGKVRGLEVSEKELAKAIPYGLPWEDFVEFMDQTPGAIANELRRRGIWEFGDLSIQVLQKINRAFHVKTFLERAAKEAKK